MKRERMWWNGWWGGGRVGVEKKGEVEGWGLERGEGESRRERWNGTTELMKVEKMEMIQ